MNSFQLVGLPVEAFSSLFALSDAELLERNVHRVSCGFDSHRPLHSQATPGHPGLQDWGQDIDPMGKSWESTLRGAAVSWPHVSLLRPEIHTYSHTHPRIPVLILYLYWRH